MRQGDKRYDDEGQVAGYGKRNSFMPYVAQTPDGAEIAVQQHEQHSYHSIPGIP